MNPYENIDQIKERQINSLLLRFMFRKYEKHGLKGIVDYWLNLYKVKPVYKGDYSEEKLQESRKKLRI
ncbi:MAG: hypothetical protein GF347_03410 [Candidatus Moranbacteria bacterium]|nr:hypothetical protein [Candidatus Moranbacteria bacterium]